LDNGYSRSQMLAAKMSHSRQTGDTGRLKKQTEGFTAKKSPQSSRLLATFALPEVNALLAKSC